MAYKIIYEDKNLIAVEKPSGIIVFPEGNIIEKTLIDFLLEKRPELKEVGKPKRYGIVHRLDKDTSGIILIAKNNNSLDYFQQEFQERRVIKKYQALVVGKVKKNTEEIKTLIGRSSGDRRKQKCFPINEEGKGRREAISIYKVIKNFEQYTLLEVEIKTGRKHQIRSHMAYINHPIAGDKLYSFKNQIIPEGLDTHFLHAGYLKIILPNKKEIEIKSDLPKNLQIVLEKLKQIYE